MAWIQNRMVVNYIRHLPAAQRPTAWAELLVELDREARSDPAFDAWFTGALNAAAKLAEERRRRQVIKAGA